MNSARDAYLGKSNDRHEMKTLFIRSTSVSTWLSSRYSVIFTVIFDEYESAVHSKVYSFLTKCAVVMDLMMSGHITETKISAKC